MVKTLIVGGGGREHALAWKLSQSKRVDKVYVSPGNGGTKKIQKTENLDIKPTDINGLMRFAKHKKINLTVVGPEYSLDEGIVDVFIENGLRIFGPTKSASRIESSKKFAKLLMRDMRIPTAPFRTFDDKNEARKYIINNCKFPIVIKESELASGKGVHICSTSRAAIETIKALNCKEGLIIEDFLDGPEASAHVRCDGKESVILPLSKDYKTLNEEGKGPNTGGMGSYAPMLVSGDVLKIIQSQIVNPVLRRLMLSGYSFRGCLYPGLKIAPQGLMVLEFNARFGDPEFQSYARLLKTDLFEILMACVEGKLSEVKIEWEEGYAVCVVLASKGYPGKCKVGHPISGTEEAEKVPGVKIFHAGTIFKNGQFITAGGRVLYVTATGKTLRGARNRAYRAVKLIHFKDMQYRKDIALCQN